MISSVARPLRPSPRTSTPRCSISPSLSPSHPPSRRLAPAPRPSPTPPSSPPESCQVRHVQPPNHALERRRVTVYRVATFSLPAQTRRDVAVARVATPSHHSRLFLCGSWTYSGQRSASVSRLVGVAVWVRVRVRARTCEEASFDEMSEDDVLCLRPDGALTLEVVIEWTRGGREEGSSNVEFPHGVAEEGEGDGDHRPGDSRAMSGTGMRAMPSSRPGAKEPRAGGMGSGSGSSASRSSATASPPPPTRSSLGTSSSGTFHVPRFTRAATERAGRAMKRAPTRSRRRARMGTRVCAAVEAMVGARSVVGWGAPLFSSWPRRFGGA